MKQIISLIMVFLSIIGIADASYLTYEKFAGVIPTCGAGFDCGSVLSSPYASIGPIPLSLLGVFFYLTVFVLSCCLFLEVPLKKLSWVFLLQLLTSTGFAFSLVLVGLMAFVIKAWCAYCLVSAATSTSLFIASLWLHHENKTARK